MVQIFSYAVNIITLGKRQSTEYFSDVVDDL